MTIEFLTRRNTVLEALRGSKREVRGLYLQQDLPKKISAPIVSIAKKRQVPIHLVSKQKLGQMAKDNKHQGVLLEVGSYEYSTIETILDLAASRQEMPILLLLDLIHGPQNIGTLLRTAEVCGVHGVIVQDRRAPEITPAVAQYSVGASEHLLIAQVTNLVQCINQLKEAGIWVMGMDLDDQAQTLSEVDLNVPIAIVVGHEGSGLRRLVRKECDILIRLPMRGNVESLNAAVAGSILLFEAWQARGFEGANQIRSTDSP